MMVMDPLRAVRKALDAQKRAALLTVTQLSGDPPSRKGMMMTVTEDASHGSLGCDGFDRAGAKDGLRALQTGDSFEARYRWDPTSYVTVEIRVYGPGDRVPGLPEDIPELLVVGSGPVASALVALGEAMGFQVRVAAGPQPPSVGELDGADEVILTPDWRAVAAIRPGPNTYVVICGHDHEFSQPVLRALLATQAPYLGMMGSRRHTGHLYDDLRASGVGDADLARVHSPVGLDVGAETPEEVALSALAHVVSVRRGGTGLPLDAR